MKHLVTTLTLTLVLLGGNSAMAIYGGPLLEKTYITGYVPEEKAYNLKCTIYTDRVELIYRKSGFSAQIKKDMDLPDETFDLISGAYKGALTSRPAPADIGFSIYQAYHIEPNDSATRVDLGSIFDSEAITTNSAPEAQLLKDLIDSTCLPLVPVPLN